jgi:hypothetical protein
LTWWLLWSRTPDAKGRGEKCQWHFARKLSDENLFSIAKFQACRR